MRKLPGISIICAAGLVAGLLAGCATLRQPAPAPPPPTVMTPEAPEMPSAAPNPPPVSAPTAETPPTPPSSSASFPTTVATAKPAASGAGALAGRYFLLIDSAPAGALIVVNEQPVGKAPLRLAVQGTAEGFFKDYLTIRARFLADSPQEVSLSVAQNFTPLDKIPAKLTFTPQGAQRQLRE